MLLQSHSSLGRLNFTVSEVLNQHFVYVFKWRTLCFQFTQKNVSMKFPSNILTVDCARVCYWWFFFKLCYVASAIQVIQRIIFFITFTVMLVQACPSFSTSIIWSERYELKRTLYHRLSTQCQHFLPCFLYYYNIPCQYWSCSNQYGTISTLSLLTYKFWLDLDNRSTNDRDWLLKQFANPSCIFSYKQSLKASKTELLAIVLKS